VYWCRDEVLPLWIGKGVSAVIPDVAFIVLTIVVFAVLALAVRGVERLVGQALGSERAEQPGAEDGVTR
jgi:hypothetical protein